MHRLLFFGKWHKRHVYQSLCTLYTLCMCIEEEQMEGTEKREKETEPKKTHIFGWFDYIRPLIRIYKYCARLNNKIRGLRNSTNNCQLSKENSENFYVFDDNALSRFAFQPYIIAWVLCKKKNWNGNNNNKFKLLLFTTFYGIHVFVRGNFAFSYPATELKNFQVFESNKITFAIFHLWRNRRKKRSYESMFVDCWMRHR